MKLITFEKERITKNIILTIAVALVISATAIVVIYSSGTYGTPHRHNLAIPATSIGTVVAAYQ